MAFFLLRPDVVGQPIVVDKFLTPEECKAIIHSGESNLELKAGGTEDGQVNQELRKSEISWFSPDAEQTWLFNKIKDCMNGVNTDWFRYNLIGFEGIQFTKYSYRSDEEPDYYSSHRDTMLLPGGTIRKLSFTVQLSDPEVYRGGDVLLYYSLSDPSPLSRALGSISFFPSYTVHEVTPVTKGIRYSLVGWACGPAFA